MTSLAKTLIYVGAAGLVLFVGYKVYAYRKKDGELYFPRSIICIGDSITAFKHGYTKTLRGLLGSGNVVQTFGYSGKGTKYLASELSKLYTVGTTDVVIQGGVNDLASGRSTSFVKANIDSMIDYAHNHGARAVVITILPWAGHHIGKDKVFETSVVNEWILQYSTADAVVDTSSMGDSDGKLLDFYDSGDHLHLNLNGQKKLGELIYQQGFGG